MKKIGELLNFKVDESPPSKRIEFSYQELGIEMTKMFGEKFRNRIWPLFRDKRYNERIIREAFDRYRKGEARGFNYFMGILNRK